ncbi:MULTISPECIES: tetratricopeptide repeat protein [unclassified Exiguobacterium]|uniref:tetratricopeptide repeat protein n=1 Tax=unclassified Exiguobacterium TaxID=2644629 RepID=UPI00103F9291|nr:MULTISPECIES: tetratricopeptide repeat protein [unclassified Exiguobacterium]TCI32832.1 tetratricopeptide repeat protein [Exiguobacterium sp. SH4S7]TCI42073.1 tetratricopeptide repeat protein [Exiguobacterium sp. SH5S32]TCI49446.1 tetratricopeptide repeat protein [Exiguobacterium sp. SH1S4]TCI59436.1 tetratricopeptide repeat protein [Exiguobacterium sp. SH0S2]TCI66773.1 tetratricopeptide repeat protein [Exiguobacterium sp. SH1S1]
MEYNYGNLIKVERMRNNMKQSVLARGICSISYLSKIENNQTTPSEEVLELIFKRLGLDVPLYFDFSEQVQGIKHEIRETLKDAILTRNDKDKQIKVEKYITSPVVSQSKELYTTLLMTLARFELMPGRDGKYFIELGWIEDQLDRDDKLRYALMKALTLFQLGDKEGSLELLEQLNDGLSSSHIPDWELADMRYIMGGIYYKSTDFLQAIENVRSALSYFKDNFYVERIIECHLIIGLAYKRRKRYMESLSHYDLAIKVTSATDLKHYYGMIYNNMGEIYSLLGEKEKALDYFINSLEYKTEIKSRLYSVLSLIEVYAALENPKGIIKWLEEGFALMGNQKDLDEFIYHFEIYKNCYQEQDKLSLMNSLKKAVQYFESFDEYLYTNKYALWLARELRENGKYKLATEYYEKSIAIMSRWD